MNIVSLFLEAAKQHPTRTAIVEKQHAVSFADLEQQVEDTAGYFRQKGIRKGDRVLVFIPMSIDLYRVLLALFYVGATAVFLDEWVNRKRLARCCQIAECTGFIGVSKARIFAWISPPLRKIPIFLHIKRGKRTGRESKPEAVHEANTALMTFTTGSTGIPKAADRTHGFLQAQFYALLDEMKPNAAEVDMPVLPIVLLLNLGLGRTSVIAKGKLSKPDKLNMKPILKQLQQHEVATLTSSPFFVRKLAGTSLKEGFIPRSLHTIFTGGAPVFPKEAARYCEAFPTAAVKILYGSTEAEPISSIWASELLALKKALSSGLPVGKPYDGIELQIIEYQRTSIAPCTAEEWSRMNLPNDQIGEIVVSGNHVLTQYFKSPQAFRENKVQVGNKVWHRTGDSGFMQQGKLYLTGRCAQLIPHEECVLSPFIIENALQELTGVRRGTLVLKKSQRVLVLETNEPIHTLEAQFRWIPYERIEVVASIPLDPRHHSKIDYDKLNEIL